MKSFDQLTEQEILALDNEGLNQAIRIGAIERGIRPPITLSESLKSSEWIGFTQPHGGVEVWEIALGDGGYPGRRGTGLAYLDRDLAVRACEGAIMLENKYHKGASVEVIKTGDAVVQRRVIGDPNSPSISKATKFQEFTEEPEVEEAFTKYRDECLDRYSTLRQAAYDRKVALERKAQYLTLANGNVEVAKAFWSKTIPNTPWPE